MTPELKWIDKAFTTAVQIPVYTEAMSTHIVWSLNGNFSANNPCFPPPQQGVQNSQIVGTQFVLLWADIRFRIFAAVAAQFDETQSDTDFLRIVVWKQQNNKTFDLVSPPLVSLFNQPIDQKYYKVYYDRIVDRTGQRSDVNNIIGTSMHPSTKYYRFKIPLKMMVSQKSGQDLTTAYTFEQDMFISIMSRNGRTAITPNTLSNYFVDEWYCRYYYVDP